MLFEAVFATLPEHGKYSSVNDLCQWKSKAWRINFLVVSIILGLAHARTCAQLRVSEVVLNLTLLSEIRFASCLVQFAKNYTKILLDLSNID